MRLVCGPDTFDLIGADDALNVLLYGQPRTKNQGSAGKAVEQEMQRRRLEASPRAWDFLSLALSVVAADFAGLRNRSPDGWTREFELEVAVADPDFWGSQIELLTKTLAFLTTDRWQLHFHEGGFAPTSSRRPVQPEENCVTLLSGGLDSLIGAIDLVGAGWKPFAVSQTVRGDADKQTTFAKQIGAGLNHLQLNHNAHIPGLQESSQRARSLIFIAFGVLAATTLRRYHDGETVPLYVCENGFIALNPPLTGARLGSLSTRTAHPEYLVRLQRLLDTAGLRVSLKNPYRAKTKGEMLRSCTEPTLLKAQAAHSTSCSRFQRFNYRHCGRCVPCQVRRAAFIAWGIRDTTSYVYEPLGKNDSDHAGFDDVRSVAMALATVAADGLDTWLGASLSSPLIDDRLTLKTMVQHGLDELRALHEAYDVR